MCPKCNKEIAENDQKQFVTSTLSITLDNNLVTYRIFHNVVLSIFQHFKEDLPALAEDIEDAILDHLPLRCKYNLGYGTNNNIIANIKLDI